MACLGVEGGPGGCFCLSHREYIWVFSRWVVCQCLWLPLCGVQCVFLVYDPKKHVCAPVCLFGWKLLVPKTRATVCVKRAVCA